MNQKLMVLWIRSSTVFFFGSLETNATTETREEKKQQQRLRRIHECFAKQKKPKENDSGD